MKFIPEHIPLIIFGLFVLGATITAFVLDIKHKRKILLINKEFERWEKKLHKLFRDWGNFNEEQVEKYSTGCDLMREYRRLSDQDLSNRIRIIKDIEKEFLSEFKAEHREKRLKELLEE